MSGFESFLTGFLGRTTEVIAERKDKAEDYFDQSIERARTIGQDQLRQRTENQQAMLSVANNLINQANMPEDLVRQIANDGPQALEQAYQIYATNAEAGIQVDENFWRNGYDFYTEVAGDSDLSLEDFLGQVNGLYGSNLAATTQEGGDPFGAFIASGLGLNAMERARGRLDNYDIGGYSASDLLAMEARPSTTRPLGDTNFSGPDLAAVTPRRASGFNPDGEERLRIQERFDEAVDKEAESLFADYQASASGGDQAANLTLEDFRAQAQQNIAVAYVSTLGVESLDFFPEWGLYLPEGFLNGEEPSDVAPPPDTGSITTTTLPPAGSSVLPPDDPIAGIQIPEEAPVAAGPSAPEPTAFDASVPSLTLEDGTMAEYVGTTPSGRMRYRLEDGSFVEGTRDEIDAIIAAGGAKEVPAMGLGSFDTSQPLNDE